MLDIVSKKGTILQTNMYIFFQNGHSIVIDPRPDMEENELNGSILDCIIVTHEHYDHICGINRWVESFGCPVWCGHAAVQGLRDPQINLSHYGSGLFRLLPQWEECDNEFDEIQDYSCNANVLLKNGQIFTGRAIRSLFWRHRGTPRAASACW